MAESSEPSPDPDQGVEKEIVSAAAEWAEQQAEIEKDVASAAAAEWAKQQEEMKPRKKKFAVVGGGWGGWGAAKALCEAQEDVEVTLLDALPDPTGATPFLSKTGKAGKSKQ
jgi:NADPH-dependent 2,4-dienoyl-CoA reductase/sulfur reductase-like enzyme